MSRGSGRTGMWKASAPRVLPRSGPSSEAGSFGLEKGARLLGDLFREGVDDPQIVHPFEEACVVRVDPPRVGTADELGVERKGGGHVPHGGGIGDEVEAAHAHGMVRLEEPYQGP